MRGSFVLDFLQDAKECQTVPALACTLQTYMDDIGLSRWAHVIADQITHTYPIEWVERYQAKRYVEIDPVSTKGRRLKVPFRWSQVASFDEMSKRESDYYREAMSFGLVDGIGVPIFGKCNEALFSMASDENKIDLEKRIRAYGDQYIALAFSFNAVYGLIHREAAAENPLSPKEVECLLWTSRGKTSWEIARILNVSERTVIFHIENCKRKLGVNNRAQACARAIAAGYITP